MEQLQKPPHNAIELLISAWVSWGFDYGKTIPNKSALSMYSIAPIIPYMTLYERCQDKGAKFKIVGEQIKLLHASDVEGQTTVTAMPVQESQINFHHAITAAIFDMPQGIYLKRSVPGPSGRRWLYESLVLPLIGPKGGIDHGILVGKISPPENSDTRVWKNILAFDFSNTYITHAQSIDLGFGVSDFSTSLPHNVQLLQPKSIRAIPVPENRPPVSNINMPCRAFNVTQ